MRLKWLTNAYDPRKPDARTYFRFMANRDKAEEWAEHQKWLEDKIIRRPKASSDHTVEQLESAGIVGIYHSQSS